MSSICPGNARRFRIASASPLSLVVVLWGCGGLVSQDTPTTEAGATDATMDASLTDVEASLDGSNEDEPESTLTSIAIDDIEIRASPTVTHDPSVDPLDPV